MNDQGFIDLRLNRQEGQTSENFWPSFTDIMTVIVTIFLIAMVVVLLRNLELVKQLRSTVEAEREAMELARTTGEEKQSLSLRLNDAENELATLRMKHLRLNEQKDTLETRAADQEKRLASLGQERDNLSTKVTGLESDKTLREKELADLRSKLSGNEQQLKNATDQGQRLTTELASTSSLLTQSKARVKELETDLATSRAAQSGSEQKLNDLLLRQQDLTQELKTLRGTHDSQKKELEQARAKISVTDKRLADLQGNFDELQFKYDKLVKPARTANGKTVVEVRYSKVNSEYHIEYKEPNQTGYTTASRSELERRLAELRDKNPDALYIKIIFPDNSGLSYGEAWRFTSELHKAYDYYYREAAPN